MNEPVDQYADMLHLPHHRSKRHVPMPLLDRAAQFSAFAALSGHSAAISETARLTESAPELSDHAKAEIDARLRLVLRHPGGEVCLTYFVADAHKAGGACITLTGVIRKLDAARQLLMMQDGRTVPLHSIVALQLL